MYLNISNYNIFSTSPSVNCDHYGSMTSSSCQLCLTVFGCCGNDVGSCGGDCKIDPLDTSLTICVLNDTLSVDCGGGATASSCQLCSDDAASCGGDCTFAYDGSWNCVPKGMPS